MGNNQSETKYPGNTLVSEDEQMILVKNEGGDQFVIKKSSVGQENVLNSFLQLSHPHIVHHKEVIGDGDCLYLVLEHCEGGDLAQKIKRKIEAAESFENEILDWTVKISMALKYLHDQQIQHKNLQPKELINVGATHGRVAASSVLPSPNTVATHCRNLAEEKREELAKQVKEILIKGGKVGMSTDMWTDDFRKIHYLSITCHYVTEDFELIGKNLTMATFPVDGR
ncbi:unnamed protein product [Leuciscus chuanchicus]